MKTINLVMIVKNEERCLDRCLTCVKPLVDGIIIVDTGSADHTKQIARSHGAYVYDFVWNHDFSAARNYAISKSSSDWNLVLDADEYLIEGCRKDLDGFLDNPKQIGVVRNISYYTDQDGINSSSFYISRLLPSGITYEGRIHEQVQSSLPRIPVPLILEHDGYLVNDRKKGERNLLILLEEVKKYPLDSYYLYQTAVTLFNLREYQKATEYFHRFYSLVPDNAGYRVQGIISYIYNTIESGQLDSLLPIIHKESSLLASNTDFNFACGVYFTKLVLSDTGKYLAYLGEIEARYLKCLEAGEHPQQQGTLGTGSFKAAYNLGVWYEVSGNLVKAVSYYKQAAEQGFIPAVNRLGILSPKS